MNGKATILSVTLIIELQLKIGNYMKKNHTKLKPYMIYGENKLVIDQLGENSIEHRRIMTYSEQAKTSMVSYGK